MRTASPSTSSKSSALQRPQAPPIRRSIRNRLWFGGYSVAIFLASLVIGNFFIASDRSVSMKMLGHDFTAFYTGGTFITHGRTGELYNIEAVGNFEQDLGRSAGLELGKGIGPFWNPPFYAWLFAPLAFFPYRTALAVWLAVNLLALAAAIALLIRMFNAPSPNADPNAPRPSADWRNWGLIPLLIIASMPFFQGFSHGQNSFTSLFLLTATVVAWRSGRAWTAGLIAGLLFYKPQVAAVVAGVMIICLGWRALAGIAITGSALLAVTLITLPGTLSVYLHQLPINVHIMQIEHDYLWERHATIKAFWRLLLQGRSAGEPTLFLNVLYIASTLAIGGALLWATIHARRVIGRSRRALNTGLASLATDRLICATVAAMPLLMPFYFDYDLILLAVPAVLLGRETVRCSVAPIDRKLIASWALLFVWLFFNSAIAQKTRLNLTVLLETMVTLQLILRAGRVDSAMIRTPSMDQPKSRKQITLAAAA